MTHLRIQGKAAVPRDEIDRVDLPATASLIPGPAIAVA